VLNPLGRDALLDLDHLGVQHVGLLDRQLEEEGARLRADLKRVLESLGLESAKSLFKLTMRRADRSPLRSRRALVATVVPIRRYSMRLVSMGTSLGIDSPVNHSSTRRTPSRGASE
jgi:hypothetical protein